MIVTVTPNTALDHTLFIPALTPNTTIRATHSLMSVAGKATDTAWVLCELGLPAVALGFAAGRLGEQMDAMLRNKGVATDFVWVGEQERLLRPVPVDNWDIRVRLDLAARRLDEREAAQGVDRTLVWKDGQVRRCTETSAGPESGPKKARTRASNRRVPLDDPF